MIKKYPDPLKRKDSKYFFFWFREPDGTRKKVSTGFSRGQKEQAREFIRQYVDRKSGGLSHTFRNYSNPYFIMTTCPRVQRLKQEGKTIGETHVKKSRSWSDRHILTDHFADIPLNEIRRADVLDLRSRLLKAGNGENTVNKAMDTVKSILGEAAYRQDLAYNPAGEVGKLKYKQQEKTKLDMNEIQDILSYASNPIGWEVSRIEREIMTGSHENYKEAYHKAIKERLKISIPQAETAQKETLTGLLVSFFACTGCRVGEVRAMRWKNIDLETGRTKIHEAFKSEKELGLPKWNITREIVLTTSLLSQLKKWKDATYYNGSDNFIFSTADGESVGITWIRKNFIKFINKIDKDPNSNFVIGDHTITPHIYRHSLNTNLLAAEVSPLLVQTFLGWSR